MQTGLYCLKRIAVLCFVWISTLCCLWNLTLSFWEARSKEAPVASVQKPQNRARLSTGGWHRHWVRAVLQEKSPSLSLGHFWKREVIPGSVSRQRFNAEKAQLQCKLSSRVKWAFYLKHLLKIKWPCRRLGFINFYHILQLLKGVIELQPLSPSAFIEQ